MADICTCSGYSITQGLYSERHGFSKKLFVAICVFVTITMCLTPTEAASLAHKDSRPETKELAELSSGLQRNHRRRHQRHLTKMTKDEEHMIKIIRILKYTKNDFRDHKYRVNDSEIYRNPKIKVPATNFLEIKRFLQSFKNKSITAMAREHKFVFIAVRLYKSLFKYNEIFKALQKVEVVALDVLFSGYQARRKDFLGEILRNLNYILPVIGDGLRDFKKNVDLANPLGEKEEHILRSFRSEIEAIDKAETCLKYDGSIFRGYGILLKKWYCFVTSKQDRTSRENARCRSIESKMKAPKKHRKQKKKLRTSTV